MLCTLLFMSTSVSNELVFRLHSSSSSAGRNGRRYDENEEMKMSMSSQRCCASHWLSQLIKNALTHSHLDLSNWKRSQMIHFNYLKASYFSIETFLTLLRPFVAFEPRLMISEMMNLNEKWEEHKDALVVSVISYIFTSLWRQAKAVEKDWLRNYWVFVHIS